MKTIYVVIAHGGEYEDAWENIDKAFLSKEIAQEYLNVCQSESDRIVKRINDIVLEFKDSNIRSVRNRCTELNSYLYNDLADFFRMEFVELEE